VRLWLVFLGLLPILLVGSGPGAGANTPALPPQNGLIAIYGVDGLNLVDPAVGSAVTVPETWDATDAVWSPDGTRLAMTLWGVEGTAPGVYTMKPDGSDRVLVTTGLVSSPTWSPDGEWLAVVRTPDSELGDEGSRLVVVSADGGDERVLLPKAGATPIYFTTLAWSPDGKLIAFVGNDGRIGLVTPDGEKGGVFDVNAAGSLSWSPDSSRLAFDSFRETKSDSRHAVVVLDVATGKETLLLGEQDGARGPAWSPEGDQIAFLSMRLRASEPTTTTHSCGGEPYETHLWSMRPDGTKARRLAKGEFSSGPSWGRAAEMVSTPASVADQQPVPTPVAQP
jgi:Tol biopolymer transport system component